MCLFPWFCKGVSHCSSFPSLKPELKNVFLLLLLWPENPEDSRLGSLFNEETFTTSNVLKQEHVAIRTECILYYEMFLSYKNEVLCLLRF